ncbi:MAG: hypothetical protein HRT99_04305 [Mycoplasmatales bacterium]|nr:hypothetical protein [Mycoplasmatales bacterium]
MKYRLITNGILNLVTSSLVIIIVTLLTLFFVSDMPMEVILHFIVIQYLTAIASVTMGIVTLSMKKHSSVFGLSIASGVLAILNGIPIAGAVVSFIAVHKINSLKVEQ